MRLSIGESALGVALIGLPLGVQVSLMLADKILKIFNVKIILCLGIPMIGSSLILTSISSGPTSLFLFLSFGGLAVGVVEVAVNLEADRVEYTSCKKIMNRSHSFWSLGFFSAGLAGAFLSQLQIGLMTHFIISFVSCSTLTVIFSYNYNPAPVRPNVTKESPLFVLPSNAVLALVIFTLPAMLIEGAGIDWSIIFMRDVFNTPPFLSGLAFVLGTFGQFLVRFFADGIVTRYGSELVSRTSIIATLIGLIFVCFSLHPFLALIGFGLMGAGTAVIFPLAMSAAAQRTDKPAAANVASLAQISFLTFLIGPPLLGFIAEVFGIKISFGICLPLLIISWVFVHTVKENRY
ncbi:MAG: MFS transporter [Pseudomonadota bacterium]|nr:MFS transporter [Pseudomonadota bacterium]